MWQGLMGILLVPFYVIGAWILGAPGITIHIKCALLGLRLFFGGRVSLLTAYKLICSPMDSTRYFEFQEVLKTLSDVPFEKYLDVSSPRIAPLMLLMHNRAAAVDMLNPDSRDIQQTERLARALGLIDRCRLTNSTIETAKYGLGAFDLITCISVLEHISEDRKAVEVMWSLLRPGGRLILTVPCMAQPLEQYISHNDYGVLPSGSDGYTFWQRFYDAERLRSCVFAVTGAPVKTVVYGERSYGLFYRNASMKRLLCRLYPFWRESYMMAKEYRYFKGISALPGEGVVMIELVKP
jgi:SAM-dependent methyltransferase